MTDTSALEARTEAALAGDDGRYAVSSSLEVGQILQNLARRAVLLTADLAGIIQLERERWARSA